MVSERSIQIGIDSELETFDGKAVISVSVFACLISVVVINISVGGEVV